MSKKLVKWIPCNNLSCEHEYPEECGPDWYIYEDEPKEAVEETTGAKVGDTVYELVSSGTNEGLYLTLEAAKKTALDLDGTSENPVEWFKVDVYGVIPVWRYKYYILEQSRWVTSGTQITCRRVTG